MRAILRARQKLVAVVDALGWLDMVDPGLIERYLVAVGEARHLPAILTSKERAQRINFLGDCLILIFASAAATKVPGLFAWHSTVFAGMAVGAILAWAWGGRVLRHYDVWNGRGVGEDFVLTAVLLGIDLAVLGALRPVIPSYASGSSWARFVLVAVPAILWLRLTTSWLRRREVPLEHILVIGIGPLGRHTGLEIRDRYHQQRLFGYLRFADEPLQNRLPAHVYGKASDLEQLLKEHVIQEVYLASHWDADRNEMQAAVDVLERFGIPFALPASQLRLGRARPENQKMLADGYIHYRSVRPKPVQQALKRGFDILASGTALLLLLPLLGAVALLIKATSRGPLLFRQERVGLHGRFFHMLKFRSMVANAEELRAKLFAQYEQQGPVLKIRRDPRVTLVGRFIRKYSIDELPQLLNVLRGEMSLVGPRPLLPSELAKYEAWQRRRLSVRPGLTSFWQVSGRHQISFEEWLYLDMQYIDHWSLANDFQLILKTVPIVLTGRGGR